MTVGSLLIYLVGVPWLMAAEDLAVGEAIRLGLLPYLLGDLVKIVLAAAILPAAWWVVGRRPVAS
jgi:biotin transport system substrate-specific component